MQLSCFIVHWCRSAAVFNVFCKVCSGFCLTDLVLCGLAGRDFYPGIIDSKREVALLKLWFPAEASERVRLLRLSQMWLSKDIPRASNAVTRFFSTCTQNASVDIYISSRAVTFAPLLQNDQQWIGFKVNLADCAGPQMEELHCAYFQWDDF